MNLTLFAFELSLINFLFFEPPGPTGPDGLPKTVSQGLAEHPGVGVALLICIITETTQILVNSCHRVLCSVLMWGTLASLIGVLLYPCDGPDTTDHMLFAGGFFIGTLLLCLLCWYEGKSHWLQALSVVIMFVFVFISFFMWPAAIGALEATYFYFMINAWSPHPGWKKGASLTSLFKIDL